MKKRIHIFAAGIFLLAGLAAHAEVKVAVGHNDSDDATAGFKFKNVPSPSASDAATKAKFVIVDGERDPNGGDVDKLNDGQLPTNADQPEENFFFNAGTSGGRLQADLGGLINLRQVNTYSWHPGTRGPQLYTLYASDGKAGNFNATPKKETDPETCGWKLVTKVNTKAKKDADDGGGQYGVSISDSDGSLGKYRYLLFDIASTESEDNFGNTFYSEIDVIDADAPETSQQSAVQAAPTAPFVIKTADGKCEIIINTAKAPELKDWAEGKLASVLAEWYPKIVAILPSEGFTAPEHFSITIKPMDGVAYTSGSQVVANSTWLGTELHGQAVGSLVHEAVHVVQHFHGNNPGWLVEGTADYVRWFKYEPESHGADIVWMRGLRHFTPRYDGSYRITANFLNWVTEKHDHDIVTQLNAAMRKNQYDENLWKQYTGKTVQELGEEWKQDIETQLAPQSADSAASKKTN
jgi:hypothetical protein